MTDLEVDTNSGTVRGDRHEDVRIFRGIPYAAQPVAGNRFAPPQPVAPWAGVRDATVSRSPAPQLTVEGSPIGREDCLYLNVYAPESAGPLPVLVWIHGGGAVVGSPDDFDGRALARRGAVVVTVAYRLGVLGWLTLPSEVAGEGSSNLALQDTIAALAWVRDNIATVGGDPQRVTVFGQSNGARMVGTLLAMPTAAGLFRRAVVQSGTGVGYAVYQPDDATHLTQVVLSHLGLELAAAGKLRELPVEALLDAQRHLSQVWPTTLPFLPVIDGRTLPQRPIDALAGGSGKGVDLLIGHNHDEYDLDPMLPPTVMVRADQIDDMVDRYRPWCAGLLDDQLRRQVATAADFWVPGVRFAEAQFASGGNVWMYRLDWRLVEGGHPGSPHGLDVPFVSGDLDGPAYADAFRAHRTDMARAQCISDVMQQAWVSFADSGAPTAAGLPAWPRYERGQRSTMLLDDESRIADDPDRELRLLWQDVVYARQ